MQTRDLEKVDKGGTTIQALSLPKISGMNGCISTKKKIRKSKTSAYLSPIKLKKVLSHFIENYVYMYVLLAYSLHR